LPAPASAGEDSVSTFARESDVIEDEAARLHGNAALAGLSPWLAAA